MPQQVETTNYDWKWYYSVPGFAIWLVLILAVAVPRSNRDPRVLLIFMALAVVNLMWLIVRKITGMTSLSAIQFDTMIRSVAVGIAVLWLTAGSFGKFRAFVRFMLALCALVIASGLGILSYSTVFSDETIMSLALFVFLALVILAATVLAKVVCKGKYRPGRFMAWLALWVVLGSMFAVFALILIANCIFSSGLSWSEVLRALLISVTTGTLLGLGLYVLNLPFMILGFANPFFRKRLCGCLGLTPSTSTTNQSDYDSIAE